MDFGRSCYDVQIDDKGNESAVFQSVEIKGAIP